MVKIAIPEGTKPAEAFEVIPAGWYTVALAAAEYKRREGQQLDRIAYSFEVIDGDCKGRKVFGGWNIPAQGMTNLDEGKKQAVDISDRHLASLIQAALGEGQTCDDTDKLIGKPVMAKVKVRPAANGFDASNEITAFAKVGDEKATKPTPGSGGNTKGKASGPAWAR